MFKEVTIGKKRVALLANGATPIYYHQVFKNDILQIFDQSDDPFKAVNVHAPEIAYILAKQAEYKDEVAKLSTLSYEDFITWLSQFEALDISGASDSIINVYLGDQETTSEAKKNEKENLKE